MVLDPKKLLKEQTNELLKRLEQLEKTPSVAEKHLAERIQEIQDEMESLEASDMEEAEMQEHLRRLEDSRNRAFRRLVNKSEGRMMNVGKRFSSMVNTVAGSRATGSNIASMSRSPEVMGYAATMGGQVSPFQVRAEMERNAVHLSESERAVQTAAVNIRGEGGKDQFASAMGQYQERVQRQAQLQAITEYQKKAGIDVNSTLTAAMSNQGRIMSTREDREISERIRDGKIDSFQNENNKLKNIEDQLIATLERFNKAMAENSSTAEEHHKELMKLNSEYGNQRKLVDQMGKGGGDGSRSALGAFTGNVAGTIGNLGNIVYNGAQVYRAYNNTLPYAQRELGIRGAEMANQQFDDTYAALKGDAAALRRVTSGLYARQAKDAKDYYDVENKTQIAEVGAKGAMLVNKVWQSGSRELQGGDTLAESAGNWAGTLFNPAARAAYSTTKVLSDVAPNVADIAIQGRGAYLGIPQTQAAFDAAEQRRRMEDVVNAIGDRTSQAYMDYNRSTTIATRGLGGTGTSASARFGVPQAASLMGPPAPPAAQPGSIEGAAASSQGDDIDYETFRRSIARVESSNDPGARNPKSSARGKYQFTKLWDPWIKKNFGWDESDWMPSGSDPKDRLLAGSRQDKIFKKMYEDEILPQAKSLADTTYGKDLSTSERAAIVHRSGYTAGRRYLMSGIDEFDGVQGNTHISKYVAGVGNRSGELPSAGARALASAPSFPDNDGLSQRERIMRELQDMGKVRETTDLTGLSPEEISRLTATGVQGLGKQFGGLSDIRRAGQIQRAGYMSADEYMQRTSALSEMGGNRDDLEEIMKRAIAAGMDSSKNIGQLVSGIQAVSSHSAGMGISTVVGSTELLGRAVQSLDIPENMRAGAAANAVGALNNNLGNRDFSLNNVLEAARLRKAFPGANMEQWQAMSVMTADQVATLSAAGKPGASQAQISAAQALAKTSGTDDIFFKGGKPNLEAINSYRRIQERSAVETATSLGLGHQYRVQAGELIDQDRFGELMNDPARARSLQAQTFRKGYNGAAYYGASVFGQQAKTGEINTNVSGQVGVGEDKIRVGAAADTKMIEAGAAKLNEAAGGLSNVVKVLEQVLKHNFDPNKQGQTAKDANDKMTMPADITGGFGKSVVDFDVSVKEFKKAIDALSNLSGKTPGSKDALFEAQRELDKNLNLRDATRRGGP